MGIAHTVEGRGIIAYDRDELADAAAFVAEAVELFSRFDNPGCSAHALEAAAAIIGRTGPAPRSPPNSSAPPTSSGAGVVQPQALGDPRPPRRHRRPHSAPCQPPCARRRSTREGSTPSSRLPAPRSTRASRCGSGRRNTWREAQKLTSEVDQGRGPTTGAAYHVHWPSPGTPDRHITCKGAAISPWLICATVGPWVGCSSLPISRIRFAYTTNIRNVWRVRLL